MFSDFVFVELLLLFFSLCSVTVQFVLLFAVDVFFLFLFLVFHSSTCYGSISLSCHILLPAQMTVVLFPHFSSPELSF